MEREKKMKLIIRWKKKSVRQNSGKRCVKTGEGKGERGRGWRGQEKGDVY